MESQDQLEWYDILSVSISINKFFYFSPESLDQKAHLDQLDQPDHQESLELLDSQDLTDLLDNQDKMLRYLCP